MLVRVKAKSSGTMRNQNKSSHINLPYPRLAASRDRGQAWAPLTVPHSLSCSLWHLPWPQHVLPNPALSLVPEVWQGCARDASSTRRGQGVSWHWQRVCHLGLLASPSAPSAWHLQLDTVVGVCCPLGHLGPRCHWGGGTGWQQGWWSCSGSCRERRGEPLPGSHVPPFPPAPSLPAASPGTWRQDLSLGGGRTGLGHCQLPWDDCQAQWERPAPRVGSCSWLWQRQACDLQWPVVWGQNFLLTLLFFIAFF